MLLSLMLLLWIVVLQGSVLGALLFVLYTVDVAQIDAQVDVSEHHYAEDIQFYVHCSVSDVDDAVCHILDCIASIGG